MAVVIVVAILPFIAAEIAGQAFFSRDAPKEPGARSWALERVEASAVRSTPNAGWQRRTCADAGRAPLAATISKSTTTSTSARRPRRVSSQTRLTGRFHTSRGPWPNAASIARACRAAGLVRAGNAAVLRTRRPSAFTLCLAPPIAAGSRYLQGPGYMLMIFNFGHYSRFIPTDGRPRHLAGDASRSGWEIRAAPGRAIRSSSTSRISMGRTGSIR